MKYALALMMTGFAAVAAAQDADMNIPLEVRNMTMDDPRAKTYEPIDAPGLDASVIQAAMAKPPEPCVNLTATPRPLPNGDDQYPPRACTDMDYTQPYREAAAQATARPMPQATPLATNVQVQGGGVPMDLNALQMQRLGELDAMQGRPINMQYASTLGYMQGYTNGQQRRTQAPSRAGGNFGGFGRY